MKLVRITLIALLASTLSPLSLATNNDFSACKTVFANNTPPFINASDTKARALCFSGFAIMHSGKSRTPLYVAERLNKDMLSNAHKKRTDEFFADARLPRSERAELEDYRGSGVITGPVFESKSKTIGANHVWVPKYLYKLVYDPTAKKVWAHWIENSDDAHIAEPISYQEVVKRTGINFLPDLK
jgi:endonuclease G